MDVKNINNEYMVKNRIDLGFLFSFIKLTMLTIANKLTAKYNKKHIKFIITYYTP